MKKTSVNLIGVAFNILLCLLLALPAGAQHRDGSSDGSHPASGSGNASPRPSFNGGARPAFNGSNHTNTAPRLSNPNTGRTYSTAPRQHITPRQGVAPQKGVSASGRTGFSTTRPAYHNNPGATHATRITGTIHGGNYKVHGYYNSFYTPHLGFRLNVLPYGYYPFYWGPNQYYYSDGLYYQYLNDQYQVVEPPVGAAINALPDDAQSIVINGIQYYELNGVYYQPITKDDGSVVYQVAGKDGELNTDDGSGASEAVAAPQIGDIVASLPDGCKTIKINGQKYYVSPDGYYYQSTTDNNNNKVYKIVGTPADEPNQ